MRAILCFVVLHWWVYIGYTSIDSIWRTWKHFFVFVFVCSSDTFQQVHQVSEFYWSQLQTDFLEEYSVKTIFPIHLQLFALPMFLVHALIWIFIPKLCIDDDSKKDKSTFNSSPMFVRGSVSIISMYEPYHKCLPGCFIRPSF